MREKRRIEHRHCFQIIIIKTKVVLPQVYVTLADVQPLIYFQSSNPCPISTSLTSIPHIYVLF